MDEVELNLGTEEVAIVVPGEKFAAAMDALSSYEHSHFVEAKAFMGDRYDIVERMPTPTLDREPTLVRAGESLDERSRENLANAIDQLELVQSDLAVADDDFQDVNTRGPVAAAIEVDHAIAGIAAARLRNAIEQARYALEMFDWSVAVKRSVDVNEKAAQHDASPKLEEF